MTHLSNILSQRHTVHSCVGLFTWNQLYPNKGIILTEMWIKYWRMVMGVQWNFNIAICRANQILYRIIIRTLRTMELDLKGIIHVCLGVMLCFYAVLTPTKAVPEGRSTRYFIASSLLTYLHVLVQRHSEAIQYFNTSSLLRLLFSTGGTSSIVKNM